MTHPYMANSAPELRRELLDAVGIEDPEELFVQIPQDHRLQRPLHLPPALPAEADLQRHLSRTLARNVDCEQTLSFLGGGVWQHHVPAVCDELAQRTEFVTSEWGTPASDHGRNQAWFEFASQLGELLELDFVGLPVYSWGCAAGHAIRMASRITQRSEVLVPANLDPERAAVIRTYCEPPEMPSHITVTSVAIDASGRLDLADLEAMLSERTAAVYLETPNSLGVIEAETERIAELAHDAGAGGFIASRDEERYARAYPTLQVSIAPTTHEGEHGFTMTLFEQTSYGRRELGNDWTGNSVYLWAIVNAVYMSLLGPQGFAELGERILQRSHYAARRIDELPNASVRYGGFFKEFVVDFQRPVSDINARLRERGIFGGGEISPNSALYCVTEVHAQEDIDRLVEALAEVTA